MDKTKSNLNFVCTPHNEAKYGAIAKRVIMPGDPKRALWIAKNFLTSARLVTDVRGMSGFTGKYKGVPVTVMAHGMGIPSICIYTHELFNFYGVKVIYRVGSCGVSIKSGCKVGDVVVAKSAWSDVPTEKWLNVKCDKPNTFFPTKSCLDLIVKTAKQQNIPYHLLPVASNSFFYSNMDYKKKRKITKSEVDEMESFGLFAEAKIAKTKAACILTVSDNVETHESMSAIERQTSFKNMVKLSLEAIIKEKI